jgi:threonine/homoserine/homoserine lactone efflux protein
MSTVLAISYRKGRKMILAFVLGLFVGAFVTVLAIALTNAGR